MHDEGKASLSVIIPCFNEENTIIKLLSSVAAQEQVGEIIIIDDCSTDTSLQKIASFKDSRLILIKQTKNLGKGNAVSDGIRAASLRYVVIQDADLEYDPSEYPALLDPILLGRADVVFGSRFLSGRSRRVLYYWHSLGNKFLTTLSNIFTDLYLSDMETCYKVMTREVAKSLVITENRFGIEPEITAQIAAMKVRVYEVPISYYGRTYDEGKKITWKDGFSALRCILKYNSPRYKKQYFNNYLDKSIELKDN